jgi:Zn-dependent protease with chaperone function
LGVVGHELAHVTRRHHLRGVINNLGLFVLVSSLLATSILQQERL